MAVVQRTAPALLATLAASLSTANAESPLWGVEGVPLHEATRSVEVRRHDEPVQRRPRRDARERRGSLSLGSLLPLFDARHGPGCAARWLAIGPSAWVCEDHVRTSASLPMRPKEVPEIVPDGLPLRYHFVGRDGALGYANLSVAEEGNPDYEFQPGFAVAIIQEASKGPGQLFGLTTKGLWIPMRDVARVQGSAFAGVSLGGAALDSVAWVYTRRAALYASPAGRRLAGREVVRHERLVVLEAREKGGRPWLRVGDDQWVRGGDVRTPRATTPPPEAAPGERWIDIDVERQILTAYEGDRAVFATLISTGKGSGASILATPLGVHRIWVKLRTSDMTNLEDEDASRYYAIQDVPWVMYFKKGYGLHGAFWHDAFGTVRSHGCVNLSPLDAQWLFHWVGPRLPTGWTAVLPTEYDQGTIVSVRR